MSASEPNSPNTPSPSREELAVAPTQALRPDEPSSELATLLDGYLAELQAGRRPDRRKLLAEHPDLAVQLEQCLSGIEFIHQASAVRPSSEPLGQLGDFRIIREVGRGGMGVVYEAEQVSLKRRIALKVLRYGAAADSEAMKRFQREAETVATLHHTNIVPIFAIGCENGVNYYAMQFIEGRSLNVAVSLRETNAERPSTPSTSSSLKQQSASTPLSAIVSRSETATMVANWGLQAAEALAHAHQRGVIHRDIKPSNLILDPDGRIWLTDFGLAKRIDDVSLSMAGAILGTPRYMSPEQAAASKSPVDHRTDIYSLGATLYELATGRPLFEADSPHLVITQILTTEPPAPRVICPNLPRDFETIIVKCLAKEPERRYATAQSLADDLRAFVEGRAIKARRATLAEQAARWFKQQRRSVGVAAATVAATVFVVVGGLIAWQMHSQASLGYLTLNTPRDGDQRAEVAEVLSLNDEPVGAPFTLPTKEPLALPEGAYRLRLTAPSKVSQTYLFDIAAGAQQTHDVGLVNETVGYAIPLKSPVGVEVIQRSRHAPRDEPNVGKTSEDNSTLNARSARHAERDGYVEPLLFVGPQDSSKPTLRCYSVASRMQQRVVHEGTSSSVPQSIEPQPLWEADWSLDAPDIISFVKLPADREAWKVLPAQTDVFAWQQVLAWFDPSWFRNGVPPKVLQPARDLNGDGVEDVVWSAPQLANRQQGSFGPGPLTPKAAVLVAASGKDGKPLWWFRPQDSNSSASWLMTAPVWANDDVIVCALRSTNGPETWLEAVNAKSGESLWRSLVPHAAGTISPSLLNSAVLEFVRLSDRGSKSKPFVVAAVGRMLVAVDVESGQPTWEPHDLGERLQNPPRFADLNGDGQPEVLAVMIDDGSQPELQAILLGNRQPMWSVRLTFNRPNERAEWPLVVDLDGDGLSEVVLPDNGMKGIHFWNGVQVLDGQTGRQRWSRRLPMTRQQPANGSGNATEHYSAGPDLDGDGSRELCMVSVRRESRMQVGHQSVGYQRQEYVLYVDCFSGRDGKSVWLQRIPLGGSESSIWTGTPETPIWRGGRSTLGDGLKLVLPVRRHADQGGDGIGNASARLLFVLSAETGRLEHSAENLALPQLVDWNDDGLDDLAVFVPDDPQEFANPHNWPYKPSGKFVVLRGSPPEAFRRLDRWTEEQDFDGDGIAELSKRHDGSMGRMGDFAVLIASGRDGRFMSKWKTEWPETPHHFTVGNVQSFPPPLGDFDGDGLADLLITRDTVFSEIWDWESNHRPIVETGKIPLLMQAISSKTGRRVWGGGEFRVPDAFRPTSADGNSDSWMTMRFNRIEPRLTQAVDLDADGQPEVLQMLRLVGYGPSGQPGGGALSERQEPFVALIDGRSGAIRWFEPVMAIMTGEQLAAKFGTPDFFMGGGTHAPGLDYLRIDASTDLNGDGARDLVLTVPQQLRQGSWLQTVQVHSGHDGKILWGPKLLEGENFNNNDFNPPIISDLDGDGRPEIVLMPTKQPHVTVLRGDTGESLWTWKGSQPQHFAAPGIAVVARRLGIPARPEADATTEDKDRTGKSAHPTKRCVAVAFNETGSQWNIALLDHEGQLVERVPAASNQLWSHDLDGDGGEELLRQVDNTITATHGLHDVLWTWSLTSQSYGWISHIEPTNDGRVIVAMSGNDSVTLLDGRTGKSLSRSFRSANASSHENGRVVDLSRLTLNSAGESPRLLTRVGDSPLLLGHVVSRAVLPTDEDGRYASRMGTPARPELAESSSKRKGKSAHPTTRAAADPRLVRQLPWVPSLVEWNSSQLGVLLLKQIVRAVGLAILVLLIPFWLVRTGVRRREFGWWRAVLILAGVAIVPLGIASLRWLTRDPMSDLPLAPLMAMAVGGLMFLVWPQSVLSSVVQGDWRRLCWLLGGLFAAAAALATLLLWVDSTRMTPELRYSWHGWWLILLFAAVGVGFLLAVWQALRPSASWLRRKLTKPRS